MGLPASTNLPVVEEGQANAEVSLLYDQFRLDLAGRISRHLKCFATHRRSAAHDGHREKQLLFADGHLTRQHKEMIATLLRAEQIAPYCRLTVHGYVYACRAAPLEPLYARFRRMIYARLH